MVRTWSFIASLGAVLLLTSASSAIGPFSSVPGEFMVDSSMAFIPDATFYSGCTAGNLCESGAGLPILGSMQSSAMQSYEFSSQEQKGFVSRSGVIVDYGMPTQEDILHGKDPSSITTNLESYNHAVSARPFSAIVGSGKVVSGVNTRTGRPVQEISLGVISGVGGIQYPFSLGYSAPAPNQIFQDAARSPDGPVGVGWSFVIPSIISDHKGTSNYLDDRFYANLGPWGSGVLVTANGETYHLDSNPYVVIRPTKNSTVNSLEGWVVTFPDGTVLVLGGRTDAVRRIFQRGDRVGLFEDLAVPTLPLSSSPLQRGATYAYRWDLSEVRAPLNRGILRVEWVQTRGSVKAVNSASNATYVRESWPSSFWTAYPDFAVDASTDLAIFSSIRVLEKAALTWEGKPKEEVFAPQTYTGTNPVADTRWAIDTKYLSQISFYAESKLAQVIKFQYKNAPIDVDGVTINHRLLAAVQSANSTSAPPSDWRTWNMTYAAHTNWISSITSPDGVLTQYETTILPTGVGSEKNTFGTSSKRMVNSGFGEKGLPIQSFTGVVGEKVECHGEFCYSEVQVSRVWGTWQVPGTSPQRETGSLVLVTMKKGDGFELVFNQDFIESVLGTNGKWIMGPNPGQEIYQQWFEEKKELGKFKIHFGSDYLVLDRANELPVVYQYDGTSFVQQNIVDPLRFPSGVKSARYSNIAEGEQTIFPTGGDYFLWKLALASGGYEIVPIVRQKDGVWRSLNQNLSNCDVSNKKSEGLDIGSEPHQPYGAGCMDFTEGPPSPAQGLVIGANAKYFGVAMKASGIYQIYHFLPDRRIVNLTARIERNSSIGDGAPYNFDWWMPEKIVFGDGFFAITASQLGNNANFIVCVWRWNGTKWVSLETHGPSDRGNSTEMPAVFPTVDGYAFLSLDGGSRELKRRKLFPKVEPWVRLGSVDVNAPAFVRSTKNYTWLEFPYTGQGQGQGYVIPNQTRLFYSNGDGVVKDLSASLTDASVAPSRLFNLQISPTEDWMIGWTTNGWTIGSQVWGASTSNPDAFKMKLLYVPLKRNARSIDAGSLPAAIGWTEILQTTGGCVVNAPTANGLLDNLFAPTFALGSGFWMVSNTQSSGSYWNFHTLYPSGPSPRNVKDGMVISSVVTKSLYSGLKGQMVNSVVFSYDSSVDTANKKFGLGFDGLAQTPISNRTVIKQFASPLNVDLLKTTEQYYYTQINGGVKGQGFPGQPWKTLTTNLDGTSEKQETAYAKHTSASTWTSGWSKADQQILPLWTSHTVYDNGSTKTSTQRFDRWDTKTGQPVATMTEIQPGLGNNDFEKNEYRHQLTVNQYAPTGVLLETRSALYNGANPWAVVPGDPKLIMPQLIADCTPDATGKTKAVLLSAIQAKLGPNNVDLVGRYKLGWKTRGVDLSQLGGGQSVLPSSIAMEKISTLSEARSKTGEPKWVTDNTTEITTSIVYEGLRSLPTAVAVNADADNFGAFTAEDGQMFLNENTWASEYDPDGRWELRSGTSFDQTNPHTGRYSIKLTSTFGPTKNLFLKDASKLTRGLTATVWIYSAAPKPRIRIEQRLADGTVLGALDGGPEGGVYKPKTWQRWKVALTKANLSVALDGSGRQFFNDPNRKDYVRVWAGIEGDPATGAVWIDDFIVAPTDAKVALSSYDEFGRVISNVDPDGHVTSTEYDARGAVQAQRDERGRIFGQSSLLPSTEN